MFVKVIHIYKSGNKNDPSNYRQISLTGVPCKIMEHVLYYHIMKHLSEHNLINLYQYSFRKGYSCETQLFELVTDPHKNFNSSHSTDATFIGFAKAFDVVLHNRLLLKLSALKVNPVVIKCTGVFLFSRSQFVYMEDTFSSN